MRSLGLLWFILVSTIPLYSRPHPANAAPSDGGAKQVTLINVQAIVAPVAASDIAAEPLDSVSRLRFLGLLHQLTFSELWSVAQTYEGLKETALYSSLATQHPDVFPLPSSRLHGFQTRVDRLLGGQPLRDLVYDKAIIVMHDIARRLTADELRVVADTFVDRFHDVTRGFYTGGPLPYGLLAYRFPYLLPFSLDEFDFLLNAVGGPDWLFEEALKKDGLRAPLQSGLKNWDLFEHSVLDSVQNNVYALLKEVYRQKNRASMSKDKPLSELFSALPGESPENIKIVYEQSHGLNALFRIEAAEPPVHDPRRTDDKAILNLLNGILDYVKNLFEFKVRYRDEATLIELTHYPQTVLCMVFEVLVNDLEPFEITRLDDSFGSKKVREFFTALYNTMHQENEATRYVTGTKTHYDVLEVDRYASFSKIAQAYLQKKAFWDTSNDPRRQQDIRKIEKAYSVLSSPKDRLAYDQSLERWTPTPGASRSMLGSA